MFTFAIIFLVSLVLIVGMIVARLIYEKLHEHDEHFFHRLVSHRARKINESGKQKFHDFIKFLSYFNKRTFSLFIHLVIEKIEKYFHKATRFVRNKFPHHK